MPQFSVPPVAARPGAPFKMRSGAAPVASFAFGQSVLFSVGQHHARHHPGLRFQLGLGSYTPGSLFYFDDERPDLLWLLRGGYTPDTLFAWPAYAKPVEPEIVINSGVIDGIVSGLVGALQGEFDINVPRYLNNTTRSVQEQAVWVMGAVGAEAEQSVFVPGGSVRSRQQQAGRHFGAVAMNTDNSTAHRPAFRAPVENATAIVAARDNPLSALTPYRRVLTGRVENASRLIGARVAGFDLLSFWQRDFDAVYDNTYDAHHRAVFRAYVVVVPQPDYYPVARFTMQQPDLSGRTPDPLPEPSAWSVAAYAGDSSPAAVWHFEGQADQHLTPDQVNPVGAAQLFPVIIEGETRATWLVRYDAQGTMFNSAATRWQYASPRCRRHDVEYEEAKRPDIGKSPWIDNPRPDPDPEPPSGDTVVIPVQRRYTMLKDVSVTLEDLTPISVGDISLALDADSYAWEFSGTLHDPADIDQVRPGLNGEPVHLLITINSYEWRVLVEQVSHRRQFGKRTVTLHGRGVSALLGTPYQPQYTGLQGADLTVAQLIETHLPVGWTAIHEQPDWLVPGGAYSYQNRTPLQAISDLAQWGGAMVVPHRTDQKLTIRPRYPVLPWHFASVNPDVVIPDSVITEVSYRQTSRNFPNGVYVHGGEIGGVIGFCRLNGTAGDVLIETQTNPIMTDATGLRALGERLLAGEYTQPAVQSVSMPVDGGTIPLVEMGSLLEIVIDGQPERGVVSAVKVTADDARISQTITIGEDTGNQWLAFRSLLPADPLLIGTLSAQNGNTATMTLLGGGIMNVRGVGTVGEKYYIRSGQIQGEAPDMPVSEIII